VPELKIQPLLEFVVYPPRLELPLQLVMHWQWSLVPHGQRFSTLVY
jgi:hypothetical protein